ncbi:hypothetical protein BDR22DRAFT_960035 [Usnea florida]
MEVAGVVLGAIPIVIAALQCYKDTIKIGGRLFKRKKHVEKLIRALNEQKGALEQNLEWLSKAIDEPCDRIEELDLEDEDIREAMMGYLGSGGSTSFALAMTNAQKTISNVIRNIKGLLPDKTLPGDELSRIMELRDSGSFNVPFRKGIKLMLHEDTVDEKIFELTSSVRMLYQLQSTGTSMRQIDATVPTKHSNRLMSSLVRIQSNANHLYHAISLGWAPGCHSTHKARLMLEDRIEQPASTTRAKWSNKPLDFKVIFALDYSTACDLLWHEGNVKVVEDGPGTTSRASQISTHPPSLSSISTRIPTVTFTTMPDSSDKTLSALEVQDICRAIAQAKQEQSLLQLYLLAHQRLHCCHPVPVQQVVNSSQYISTTSLASLLTASSTTSDRSHKLPLKPRLLLALTLASTLIQLNATPWLGKIWSKHSICFSTQPSNHPTLDQHPLNPSQIDLTRPFLTQSFNNEPTALPLSNAPITHPTDPRQMILELGIMLLEIWHETSLESYSSSINQVLKDSYYDRLSLAQRWLDETEESIPPVYFHVALRCVRCCFDGVPANPVWDGCLFKGLVTGVVEPLLEQCRPRAT